MNKIVSKEQFSENVFKFEVEAPLIAKSRKAGHFVIVRIGEKGERMPLTIADADIEKGTITLVVQRIGLSSSKLCKMEVGDELTDIVGPLGQATHIEKFGTVICAGGGVGVAPMLPIIKSLKAAGNRVISVLAGRNKDLIILEDEVRKHSDEVVIMTDDGSYGKQGLVTNGIEEIIQREKVDKCFAIGPAIMMKFVCLLTKKYEIPTDVSLNTIMVDGTGMCGACRITVGGKTKFVCVDGPEFDGHQVDFDEMLKRMGAFKDIEREEIKKLEESVECALSTQTEEPTTAGNKASQEIESIDVLCDRNAAWREDLRKAMKPKERTAIERCIMPELDPVYRRSSRKEEVNQGLSEDCALYAICFSRLRAVSPSAACIDSVILSAYKITRPFALRAARPIVCISERVERKNPSLSASIIATNSHSGTSSPSRNKLIPTRTSNLPNRKSRNNSIRSNVSISLCKYFALTPFSFI